MLSHPCMDGSGHLLSTAYKGDCLYQIMSPQSSSSRAVMLAGVMSTNNSLVTVQKTYSCFH
jgi:hypothetical protein